MEELDLRREAYSQEIFRRNAQDPKLTKRFVFSAPRVFFEYSNTEVIVMDFVAGMWLWEILSAIESGNETALARMQELNIDPKVVARRLWINLSGESVDRDVPRRPPPGQRHRAGEQPRRHD